MMKKVAIILILMGAYQSFSQVTVFKIPLNLMTPSNVKENDLYKFQELRKYTFNPNTDFYEYLDNYLLKLNSMGFKVQRQSEDKFIDIRILLVLKKKDEGIKKILVNHSEFFYKGNVYSMDQEFAKNLGKYIPYTNFATLDYDYIDCDYIDSDTIQNSSKYLRNHWKH